MQKLVIVGKNVAGGITQSYNRAFTDLGFAVEIIDDEAIYRNSSSLARNKYLHRAFWPVLARRVQAQLISKILEAKPDYMFVIKGWFVHLKTIQKLKSTLPDVPVWNFNPDNPFNKKHFGITNAWIKKSIPLYDICFIWGKFLLDSLKRAGAKQVVHLPFGYDPLLHYPVQVSTEEQNHFGSGVAFVGSWDEERERWLKELLTNDHDDNKNKSYDFKIWGAGWEKASKKLQSCWTKDVVIGENFSRVCSSSKIVLNILRAQNGSAHNMRTFEVPACGGFLLSTASDEQKVFFAEDKEMVFFETHQELREKIDYYLAHEEERAQIATAAYARLQEEPYSYRDRVLQILHVQEQKI